MINSIISTPLTLTGLLMTLGCSLITGILTALVFSWKEKLSSSLALTLAVLPVTMSMVVMLINGNLGTAVAVAGGFTLVRFRSIAGCCVGTAPVALKTVWDNVVTDCGGIYCVNIPCDKKTEEYELKNYIPDEGKIVFKALKKGKFGFRLYKWMKDLSFERNDRSADALIHDGIAYFEIEANESVTLLCDITTTPVKEIARGTEFTVYYRGCDVVKMTPEGAHVRLYQRDLSVPKFYPTPADVKYTGAAKWK